MATTPNEEYSLSGRLRANEGRGTSQQTRRKVIAASFIGNFTEWFDYAVYGYLAVVIARVFFPESEHALLQTFALFAISFLVRPLGGFFWGGLGDRIGRKNALAWSILVMSGATFLIGLVPGAATIGIAAPLLLLLLRLVQGFSASGEYAGASAFLVEYAPPSKRGRYAAVVPASTASGLLFGSLLVTLMHAVLTDPQIDTWGWRVPFLLAGPLGLIGHYIRTRLEDTPEFQKLVEQDDAVEAPTKQLLVKHWRTGIIASGAVLLNAVGFYVILSYMPTYLSTELGVGDTESYLATTAALVTYIGFIFGTGSLSDRFGRRPVLLAASALFLVFTVPAFILLDPEVFWLVVLVQVVLGGMLSLNDGTLPSFLAELFPTNVRYSGFAVSFNISNALFGGTAPFVATWLIGATGSVLAPAFYLCAAAVVSGIAILVARETSKEKLRMR